MRYAALLRGINVGGNKKLAMADLRELLAGLGYDAVATYLQSGNAVFSSASSQPPSKLAAAIEKRIAKDLAAAVRVMVRTGDELADVVSRSPLADGPENPSRFFVAFLSGPPEPPAVKEIEAQDFGPDRIWVSGAEAYLWCPNGAGRTLLTNNAVEKRLGVAATSRNWNTVSKLVSLTSG
jgi:uncharacterized protein (DUF1697 family)